MFPYITLIWIGIFWNTPVVFIVRLLISNPINIFVKCIFVLLILFCFVGNKWLIFLIIREFNVILVNTCKLICLSAVHWTVRIFTPINIIVAGAERQSAVIILSGIVRGNLE